MKKKIRSYCSVAMLALTAVLIAAGTPAENKYTLSKGYTVTINGTSNLHDWNETVQTVTGQGIFTWNADGSFDLAAVNIVMVVHSIKSTEGSVMNNNTYKALKADSDPDITFLLTAPVHAVPAGGRVIPVKINLSVAGVTKPVDMSVTASSHGYGSITFEGSKTIKMTDFGIKPPVALFGTMKTGDDITIHFKTVFEINK